MQARERPRRDQKTRRGNHERRRLTAKKSTGAYADADAFIAHGNKCKAFVLSDSLLHPIESMIREDGDQIDAGIFESSNDGFTCFGFHRAAPSSYVARKKGSPLCQPCANVRVLRQSSARTGCGASNVKYLTVRPEPPSKGSCLRLHTA